MLNGERDPFDRKLELCLLTSLSTAGTSIEMLCCYVVIITRFHLNQKFCSSSLKGHSLKRNCQKRENMMGTSNSQFSYSELKSLIKSFVALEAIYQI